MQANTQQLNIRGLQYHVHTWGNPKLPILFALHGWMDCGASFRFIAQELSEHFHIIAPDLRGFGDTEHAAEGYWFPDYLADLDALLDHYQPNDKVNLLGHSMGGNIVLMYAGIRPERVSYVISLDALGIAHTSSEDTPIKYRQWLQQCRITDNLEKIVKPKTYANLAELEKAIQANNPSLSGEIVHALATSWGKTIDSGSDSKNKALVLKHDPKHRNTNPIRYNHDDILAVWKNIEATVGLVMAENSSIYKKYLSSGRFQESKKILKIPEENCYIVDKCQHMLHLEKPTETAKYILHFFNKN